MTQARNESITASTRQQIDRLYELGWYHSIELPDGTVIPGLQSIEKLRSRIAMFPIPQDLRGKRVLDIGAWDGWFSFEMERRGASVVAVDAAKQTRFLTAHELLGSKVDYHICDVFRLSPKDFGTFDIVLFFGVLYHVKHPVLALERVCEMATGMACVESYVTDPGGTGHEIPLMEFYEGTELRGQFDNWVGPNTACLLSFCRTAGFARVNLEGFIEDRAHVTCYRNWPDTPAVEPAPLLACVENSVSRDHEFAADTDEYAGLWFTCASQDIDAENVRVEIGPYGSPASVVQNSGGDGWHVNCKVPPGLRPGWYEARIKTDRSAWSNSLRIGIGLSRAERTRVDLPVTDAVRITLITDGRTWERYAVLSGPGICMSLWIAGLPEGVKREDVRIRLDGTDLGAVYLSEPDAEGLRQANALLPSGMEPGDASVAVVFRSQQTRPVAVHIV